MAEIMEKKKNNFQNGGLSYLEFLQMLFWLHDICLHVIFLPPSKFCIYSDVMALRYRQKNDFRYGVSAILDLLQQRYITYGTAFLLHNAMCKRGPCCRPVSVCLSISLSCWCIVSTPLKISSNFFVGPVAPSLVF